MKKLSSQHEFAVTLADGTVKQAALYKISESLDLALLKLNGFSTPFLSPGQVRFCPLVLRFMP